MEESTEGECTRAATGRETTRPTAQSTGSTSSSSTAMFSMVSR
ncbi:MAG: hypothetical protein ACQERN_11700 [Thermodesulfobacteriota bacterium]